MIFNNKEVFTEDTFDYSVAKPGDYVDCNVVYNAINCMPPASLRSDCTQMGEPYSHRIDENGRCRATYATFKRVCSEKSKEVWEYCGNCFLNETVERGEKLMFA